MNSFPAWLRSCPVPRLIFFVMLMGCVIGLRAQDVHAIAAKADQRYDHLHSLQACFTETYSGAGLTRTESGTLLLKKPGRMRWDYEQPRPKLFITDGSTAWFYVPGERRFYSDESGEIHYNAAGPADVNSPVLQ